MLVILLVFLMFFEFSYAVAEEETLDYGYSYWFDELPEEFNLTIGESFSLDIDFEDDYFFSEDSDLIDITKETGIFSFTPEEEGEFYTVFIALKDVMNFEYRLVKFRVVN